MKFQKFIWIGLALIIVCQIVYAESNLRGVGGDTVAPTTTTAVNSTAGDPQMISIERTATGGYIHTLLIVLTFLSFIGNGFFLVDAFWIIR